MIRKFHVLPLLIAGLIGFRCAVNPATGQHQLAFYGTEREIQMGREADETIRRTLGVVRDEALQAYVSELGLRLAAASERPDLPWSFVLLDDPIVNAFALPGGYVYITRGLFEHLNSEAELAAVLGHEIGHITGRHTVEQVSRAQLATAGLLLAMIASEDVRAYGDFAQQGLGLLFLKFGRDDEREADDLGLRYLTRVGYNPHETSNVFRTLDRISSSAGASRLPDWLSTHPSPQNRAERIDSQVAALSADRRQGTVERESFLQRVEGMIFGDDPKEGYFVGRDYYHPELRFRLEVPVGWMTRNQKHQAVAVSPEQDGVVLLTSGPGATLEEAEAAFFKQSGVGAGRALRPHYRYFNAGSREGSVSGVVGFVEQEGVVLQIMGFTPPGQWSRHARQIEQSVMSLRPLKDDYYLDVEPDRIELVHVDKAMTVKELHEGHSGPIDAQALAILNGLADASSPLPEGRLVKVVRPGKFVAARPSSRSIEGRLE